MPKITVNGIALAYEILGQGPPIVWTPGACFPRDHLAYLTAGRLSANYQVLLWDRRNSGASDIAIEDAPSNYHLWADDLHHLLNALNMSPSYVAGSSAGYVLALLMAYHHPEDVKGLILCDIGTDDLDTQKLWADALYVQLAEVAERNGMQAVIDYSTEAWVRIVSAKNPEPWDNLKIWVAQTIQMNPSNRDRLLSMDAKEFASILRKWSHWLLSGGLHRAGLSDEELGRIQAPALVVHGFDKFHPIHTAKELHRLLPNSEWVEYSERYSQEEIDQVRESDARWSKKAVLSRPFYEEFLERIETI